jgi:hypothetical protein
LISGVDRAALGNPIGGLDANSLLNGVAQGQGQGASTGDSTANNVGADIANQIAGGNSNSIDEILNGLNGQGQAPPTNQSTTQVQGQAASQGASPAGSQGMGSDIDSSNIAGDLANQLAPKAGSGENSVQDVAGDLANQLAPNGQGQLPSQSQVGVQQSGGDAQTIQVVSTIILEANGQKITTTVIEAAASGEAMTLTPPAVSSLSAVTPVSTPSEAPSSTEMIAEMPAAASTSKAAKTVTPPAKSPPAKSSLPAVTPVPWTLSRAGSNATVSPIFFSTLYRN